MTDLQEVRVIKALQLAFQVHQGQKRKGIGVPYISHVLSVAGKIVDEGGDEDQLIAGLLHDTVEDRGGSPLLEEIRKIFGDVVAKYVELCSDSMSFPKRPWLERKCEFIQRCAKYDEKVKLIVACDKWHNLYSLGLALASGNSHIWKQFKGGRDGTMWYYENIIDALKTGWEHPIVKELEDLLSLIKKR